MTNVTATQLKNTLGRYLNLLLVENEILITKNGRVIAKLVSCLENKQKAEETTEN